MCLGESGVEDATVDHSEVPLDEQFGSFWVNSADVVSMKMKGFEERTCAAFCVPEYI